jgi:hypothetical protein
MVGDLKSKRLKVAALNLFHPTASPFLRKAVFSYCGPASWGEGRVREGKIYFCK